MRHLTQWIPSGLAALALAGALAGCTSAADKALDAQAQATKMSAQTTSLQAYSNYVLELEKLNTDRQGKNLSPLPILTYEQWIAQANVKK